MKTLAAIVGSAFILLGCNTMSNSAPKGIYENIEHRGRLMRIIEQIEVTDTKFIIKTAAGEMATDFTIEDGYFYSHLGGVQIRFKIVSADTLRNEGDLGYEGTYVRKSK